MDTKDPNIIPQPIKEAMLGILDKLWESAEKDFLTSSVKESHLFQDLVQVRRWIANPDGVRDPMGECPHCANGGHDGFLNIGSQFWFVCALHRVKWDVGSHTDFDWWQDETEEEWEENRRLLSDYEEVTPAYVR